MGVLTYDLDVEAFVKDEILKRYPTHEYVVIPYI